MKVFISDNDAIVEVLNRVFPSGKKVIQIPTKAYKLGINGVGDTLYEFAAERKKFLVTLESQIESPSRSVVTSSSYEVVNACRPSPEGQLNFDLTIGKISTNAKRLWLTTLSENGVHEAVENLSNNDDFKKMGLPLLAEQIIDLYLGRRGPSVMGSRIPVTLKGLYTLCLLKKRAEEIEAYKLANYFRLTVFYGDYSGSWSDMKGEGRLASSDAAMEIMEKLNGQRVMIAYVKQDITNEKHPLLYNTPDLIKDALEAKLTAENAKWASEQLYRKGHITNPVTNCRHMTSKTAGSLMPTLKAIKDSGRHKKHIEYLQKKVGSVNLGSRVINDEFVDEQHAIIPTDNPPKGALPSEEEEVIYSLILKRFMCIFMGDHQYDKAGIRGYINSEHRIETEITKTVFHGFRIMDLDAQAVQVVLDEPKKELPRLALSLTAGEVIPIRKIEPRVRSAKEPSPYKERQLLKALDAGGYKQGSEKLKNKNRNSGIGGVENRPKIFKFLKGEGLITISEKNVIELTEQGREVAQELPNLVMQPGFVKYMNQRLLSLREGKEGIVDVVQGCCERFTSVTVQSKKLEEANQHMDYTGIIKAYDCPTCHSQLAYDDQYIHCTSRLMCNTRIAKVISGHVLTQEELGRLLKEGRTDLITTFRFKNTDNGTAYLVFNRAKGRVEFEFPPRR